MKRSRIRTAITAAAGAAALALGGVSAAPAGAASSAQEGGAVASGFWACTVPAGFSYTDTDRRNRGNCNPQGWGTAYLLVG